MLRKLVLTLVPVVAVAVLSLGVLAAEPGERPGASVSAAKIKAATARWRSLLG